MPRSEKEKYKKEETTEQETINASGSQPAGESDDNEDAADDAGMPEKARVINQARTYEVSENGCTYRIIPEIQKGGVTRFKVQVNSAGIQGQLFTGQQIPDDAADALGLSPQLQNKLNRVLREANRTLSLPESLRGESMENRPLSDLENVLTDEK